MVSLFVDPIPVFVVSQGLPVFMGLFGSAQGIFLKLVGILLRKYEPDAEHHFP